MYVKLPNSQSILITHIGDVHLSPMLVLYNALYIHHFNLNLIYVSKLLKNSPCCLTFHNNFCVIQDTHTHRRIDLGKERQGLYYLEARKIPTLNVIKSNFLACSSIKTLLITTIYGTFVLVSLPYQDYV